METKIFTIGFAQKTARQFFTILKEAGVATVIDVRLNNVSQLAAFTKKQDIQDIEYFLREIAGIAYIHKPDLAPTKEILDGYKKKTIDWNEYEKRFRRLLAERNAQNALTPQLADRAFMRREKWRRLYVWPIPTSTADGASQE